MSRAKAPDLRTGNANFAAEAEAPVVYEGRAPRVPAHLRATDREVWRAVWQAGAGAYSPDTDRNLILRYAELYDRRAALLDAVDGDGLMTIGSTGQPVVHPAMRYVVPSDSVVERDWRQRERWQQRHYWLHHRQIAEADLLQQRLLAQSYVALWSTRLGGGSWFGRSRRSARHQGDGCCCQRSNGDHSFHHGHIMTFKPPVAQSPERVNAAPEMGS